MKRGATKEEIIRITQTLIARNGIRAVRVDEIVQTLGGRFDITSALGCGTTVTVPLPVCHPGQEHLHEKI